MCQGGGATSRHPAWPGPCFVTGAITTPVSGQQGFNTSTATAEAKLQRWAMIQDQVNGEQAATAMLAGVVAYSLSESLHNGMGFGG
jgi:hypothetical protein